MSKTKSNIKLNSNLLFFVIAVIILLIVLSYRLIAAQDDMVMQEVQPTFDSSETVLFAEDEDLPCRLAEKS